MTHSPDHDNRVDHDGQLGATLRAAATPRLSGESIAERFAARLRQIAAHPERVPIRLNGTPIEARAGGTILGAALKNKLRLMHLCGARKLCSSCRVTIEAGDENLSPMSFKERLSLRGHLALGSRTRLACQARVNGPIEAQSLFPLCGNLPGD
jgi:ferredoxin, 2Fe-2S